MKPKLAIGYLITDPNPQVIVTVKSGLQGIGNNPQTFATPNPALAVVQTSLDTFETSVAVAKTGGPLDTATMNANRVSLASQVRTLTSYVESTCNGDVTKLMSSGLPLQAMNRPALGPLPVPGAPTPAQGPSSGVLVAKTGSIPGAACYNWRLALASAPNVYVQVAQTTAARVTFADLIAGQVYKVQVNVVGSAGTSDWSDDGSMMVI